MWRRRQKSHRRRGGKANGDGLHELVTVRSAAAFEPWSEAWTGHGVISPARGLHAMPHLPLLYPMGSLLLAKDELDPLVGQWAVEQALSRHRWDVLNLNYLNDATAAIERALWAAVTRQGWIPLPSGEAREAVVDFSDGVDAYWMSRSKGMRRKTRVGRRRLQKLGELAIVDAKEAELPWPKCWELIDTVFRRSWQKGAGLSPFDEPWATVNEPALAGYYGDDRLRVLFLFLDQRPLAFDIWLTDGDNLYGLVRGMDGDKAFKKMGPGVVLARDSLPRLFRGGYRRQFLGPVNDEPHYAYKRRWMTQARPFRRALALNPNTPYGFLHRLYREFGPFRRLWDQAELKRRSLALFRALRKRVRSLDRNRERA